jgi:hypothetical protein
MNKHNAQQHKAERPKLITDAALARKIGVSVTTLKRWSAKPELQFPARIEISGRGYRDNDRADEWLSRRLQGAKP